jgi:hypothetical protein
LRVRRVGGALLTEPLHLIGHVQERLSDELLATTGPSDDGQSSCVNPPLERGEGDTEHTRGDGLRNRAVKLRAKPKLRSQKPSPHAVVGDGVPGPL